MSKIIKRNIAPGIVWVEVKDADLAMCCGCPADTAKHLIKAGMIKSISTDENYLETGPNVLLLSDTLIQNGKLANLSEFVILQMLYLQGIIIPGHPNYNKFTPIVVGYEEQVNSQLNYVNIGNHGLGSIEEIMEAGFDLEKARKVVTTKLHYSAGVFRSMEEMVESRFLEDNPIEIKNQVFISRSGVNKFDLNYKNEWVEIDLGMEMHQQYQVPYNLPFKKIEPSFFSVTHCGEGNGWDVLRPCMSGVLHFNGKNFLIDAGPNVLENLHKLGISLSEIDGIFLTHVHDDHFAGITDLLNVECRLNLYCTNLIKKTAENKLRALFHSSLNLLEIAFNYHELEFDVWNDLDGLGVLPTYSPHTVETSVFRFRVQYQGLEKTYLHLADTINFREFDMIMKEAPDVFAEADRNYVRDSYLATVNLKKLDVGGGPIHGHLSDYADDQSDAFVMAHTSREIKGLDARFSNAGFGQTDHLIKTENFDYLKMRAIRFLSHYESYFSKQDIAKLGRLPYQHYVPGEQFIYDKNRGISLILSGIFGFENDLGIEQKIDAGNFIGHSRQFLSHLTNERSYTALSHACCLTIPEPVMSEIFSKNQLGPKFKEGLKLLDILLDAYLIYFSLSGSVLFDLVAEARDAYIPDDGFTDEHLAENLYILTEGSVNVKYENKFSVEIFRHQHFGGLNLLRQYRRPQRFVFNSKVKAIAIPVEKIHNIPALLWRLIELEEMRYMLGAQGIK